MLTQSRQRLQQGQSAVGSSAKHSTTKCRGFALSGNLKVGHMTKTQKTKIDLNVLIKSKP